MKKILVPVDFTPASRSASEYAAALAQLFTAQVHLLHVYMEPTPATEVPSAWIITGSEWQKENETRVNKDISYLKDSYAIDVTGEAVVGNVGDIIKEVATTTDADLIVMGMKMEKSSKILGSATFVAIRKSKVPVLVIPEGTVFTPIKHIVFASDFQEVSNISCFNLLLQLTERFNADLRLLHVQKEGKEISSAEVPGRIQMGRVLANLSSYRYEEVVDNDVDHGIKNFIEAHPTDLLVMIAHPHNIFERMFGTVHTQTMSYLAKRPLLVLKDKE